MSRTDLGWDRHPELTYTGFGYSEFLVHAETGGAVLHVIVQGRWRTEAINALREALELMLPGRVSLHFVTFGCLRVEVLLGTTSPDRSRDGLALLRPVIDRTCAAVARAIAADDFQNLPSPNPARSLPPPTSAEAGVFTAVLNSLGDAENPEVSSLGRPAPWLLLRDVAPSDAYDEWGSWMPTNTEASRAYYVSLREQPI